MNGFTLGALPQFGRRAQTDSHLGPRGEAGSPRPRANVPVMAWTNWSGSFSCEPAALLFPESEGELIELVQRAREDGGRIRVVGTGHSCTPLVATDGQLVSLDRMSGVVRAEPDERRAWVRTGTKLHDLGEPLHELGFAQPAQVVFTVREDDDHGSAGTPLHQLEGGEESIEEGCATSGSQPVERIGKRERLRRRFAEADLV